MSTGKVLLAVNKAFRLSSENVVGFIHVTSTVLIKTYCCYMHVYLQVFLVRWDPLALPAVEASLVKRLCLV